MALEKLTISLESGVFADRYSWDQLFDEPLGTSHSGNLYGWPMGCTTRSKSYNPATGRYTLQGDNDISEKLKKYLSSTSTTASGVITEIAGKVGKTATVNTDDHSLQRIADGSTIMQAFSKLYGWTYDTPNQAVVVTQRGSNINVTQRGKETSSYTLVKYDIKGWSEKILDTLMEENPADAAAAAEAEAAGETAATPVVSGDDPDDEIAEDGTNTSYFSGSFVFGGCSITFENGLNVSTKDNIDTGGEQETVTTYSLIDGEYFVTRVTVKLTSLNWLLEQTTYTYDKYNGVPYLSLTETFTQESVLLADGSASGLRLATTATTAYFPLGFEKYGQRTSSTRYNYAGDGDYESKETTSRNAIAEGRPGGASSRWSLETAQKAAASATPTAAITKNPTSADTQIPVTDAATLERYAAALEWLDGKTEYSLRVDCFDEHIVDFNQTVVCMNQTWYLQSNQINIGPGAAAKQSLELVRWG